MNGNKYRDLNILTGWINNQKAFEKHKHMLDEIYKKLNKKSACEFGINHSKSFEMLQVKLKSQVEFNKFSSKEQTFLRDKENQRLKGKIKGIQARKNILLSHEEIFNEKNQNLKKRTDLLKSIEHDKIQKENFLLGKRIISKYYIINYKRSSSLSVKKLNDEYNRKLNYKQFTSKFELPKIKTIGPNVVKRELDITVYNRNSRLTGTKSSEGSQE